MESLEKLKDALVKENAEVASLTFKLKRRDAKLAALRKEILGTHEELEDAHRCLGNLRQQRATLQGKLTDVETAMTFHKANANNDLAVVSMELERVQEESKHFQMLVRAVRLCVTGSVLPSGNGRKFYVS